MPSASLREVGSLGSRSQLVGVLMVLPRITAPSPRCTMTPNWSCVIRLLSTWAPGESSRITPQLPSVVAGGWNQSPFTVDPGAPLKCRAAEIVIGKLLGKRGEVG